MAINQDSFEYDDFLAMLPQILIYVGAIGGVCKRYKRIKDIQKKRKELLKQQNIQEEHAFDNTSDEVNFDLGIKGKKKKRKKKKKKRKSGNSKKGNSTKVLPFKTPQNTEKQKLLPAKDNTLMNNNIVDKSIKRNSKKKKKKVYKIVDKKDVHNLFLDLHSFYKKIPEKEVQDGLFNDIQMTENAYSVFVQITAASKKLYERNVITRRREILESLLDEAHERKLRLEEELGENKEQVDEEELAQFVDEVDKLNKNSSMVVSKAKEGDPTSPSPVVNKSDLGSSSSIGKKKTQPKSTKKKVSRKTKKRFKQIMGAYSEMKFVDGNNKKVKPKQKPKPKTNSPAKTKTHKKDIGDKKKKKPRKAGELKSAMGGIKF